MAGTGAAVDRIALTAGVARQVFLQQQHSRDTMGGGALSERHDRQRDRSTSSSRSLHSLSRVVLSQSVAAGVSMHESVRKLEAAFRSIASEQNKEYLEQLRQLRQQLDDVTRSKTPVQEDPSSGEPHGSPSAARDLHSSRRMLSRLDQQGRSYERQINELNATLLESSSQLEASNSSFTALSRQLEVLQGRCELLEDERVVALDPRERLSDWCLRR